MGTSKIRLLFVTLLQHYKYWVCDQVRDNPATETTCVIEFLPEVGLSVTISTDKFSGYDYITVRSVPLLFASSRDFLYQRDWNQVFSQLSPIT